MATDVSKSLWPICPGFSFLHKQNWPFKIGLTTFWASLHCIVQSVTSEWSVSFQVSWLELLGLRKLVTDTFEQSCCGTPTLTSVSQQPFYSYYPSLWRVTLPVFGYSWYVLMFGGCHWCVYVYVDIDISCVSLWSCNWIIFSLETVFYEWSGSSLEAVCGWISLLKELWVG